MIHRPTRARLKKSPTERAIERRMAKLGDKLRATIRAQDRTERCGKRKRERADG